MDQNENSGRTVVFSDNSLRELLNFRRDVILNYLKKGCKVILIAPNNADLDIAQENLIYIPISLNRSSMNPFSDLSYFFTIWRLYLKLQPNYIFHYTIKPNIYGSIAAALSRIPTTAMIAGLGYVFTGQNLGCRIARGLYRFAMHFPEKILVLNQYNRDILISKKIASADKIILLTGGEGVNLDRFNNI